MFFSDFPSLSKLPKPSPESPLKTPQDAQSVAYKKSPSSTHNDYLPALTPHEKWTLKHKERGLDS